MILHQMKIQPLMSLEPACACAWSSASTNADGLQILGSEDGSELPARLGGGCSLAQKSAVQVWHWNGALCLFRWEFCRTNAELWYSTGAVWSPIMYFIYIYICIQPPPREQVGLCPNVVISSTTKLAALFPRGKALLNKSLSFFGDRSSKQVI